MEKSDIVLGVVAFFLVSLILSTMINKTRRFEVDTKSPSYNSLQSSSGLSDSNKVGTASSEIALDGVGGSKRQEEPFVFVSLVGASTALFICIYALITAWRYGYNKGVSAEKRKNKRSIIAALLLLTVFLAFLLWQTTGRVKVEILVGRLTKPANDKVIEIYIKNNRERYQIKDIKVNNAKLGYEREGIVRLKRPPLFYVMKLNVYVVCDPNAVGWQCTGTEIKILNDEIAFSKKDLWNNWKYRGDLSTNLIGWQVREIEQNREIIGDLLFFVFVAGEIAALLLCIYTLIVLWRGKDWELSSQE